MLRMLRDDAELEFEMLTDVTAVDYLGQLPRFELVYHLYSVARNRRADARALCRRALHAASAVDPRCR